MEYTQDIIKQIEDVVEKQAAQMVGTDADKEKLEQAKKLARAAIMEEIEEAVARQMKERADMVEGYNSFCQQEMSEPDFKETQTFAVDHFFYSLDPMKQAAVADAYQRIENNTATVADIQIVMEFFTDAKNARRAAPHIMVEYIDADEEAYIRSNFVEKSVTICAHNEEEAAAAYPTAEEMYRAQA